MIKWLKGVAPEIRPEVFPDSLEADYARVLNVLAIVEPTKLARVIRQARQIADRIFRPPEFNDGGVMRVRAEFTILDLALDNLDIDMATAEDLARQQEELRDKLPELRAS